jgi:hypothetical protein
LEKGTQNAFEITNDESSKHMWSNPLLGPWNVGEEVCTKAFFSFLFFCHQCYHISSKIFLGSFPLKCSAFSSVKFLKLFFKQSFPL